MSTADLETSEEIAAYFERLWPILRSISGDGVRQTLDILCELVPLRRIEIPTGTQVLDWTVPKEWVIRAAYVIDPGGQRILDVRDNNLHIVNYSAPFRGTVSRQVLDKHLHSLPDQPAAIPYVTSYYQKRWGVCLSQQQRDRLPDGDYQVVIDTDFIDGSITIGEAILPGSEDGEVLLTTNTCHPSMANNELSGLLVTAFLYRRMAALPDRRLTCRFVFAPETIGSIAYLHLYGDHLIQKLKAGYVITCVGDPGQFIYKRSRRGDSLPDNVARYVLSRRFGEDYKTVNFAPFPGSDERQYCAPGFNLPVGSLTRTMYMEYPEYHTSLDNRNFISFDAMRESIDVYYETLKLIDQNAKYRSLFPYGEPQLGKRGLLENIGDKDEDRIRRMSAIFWVLNYSDGENDLLSISEKSTYAFENIVAAAELCESAGLIERIE